MIDITDVDPVKLLQVAYSLSVPQGLGFLHATDGSLSKEEAEFLIGHLGLSWDYIRGRAIKFHIHEENGRRYINENWYDHTDAQFKELLKRVGIVSVISMSEHGAACNCIECRKKRR